MNQSFKQFLTDEQVIESTNDKGILKAIFVVGIPGAGKSYTISQLKGAISPVIVNTDRAAEFISKKDGRDITGDTWSMYFEDRAKSITKEALYGALNGMLPLFVDGTSNNISAILHRKGILEGLGYQTGIIHVKTSLEVAKKRALERAEEIGRHVDESFIEKVWENAETATKELEGKFKFDVTVNNDSDEFDNAMWTKLYSKVQGFYAQPADNHSAVKHLEKIRDAGDQYLVPAVLSEVGLRRRVDTWYVE